MKVLIIVAVFVCVLASVFFFFQSHDGGGDIDEIAKRKVCMVVQAQADDLAIIGRKHCREPIEIFALGGRFSLQRFNVVKKSITWGEKVERAMSLLEVLSPNFSLGEVLDVREFMGEDYTLRFFSDGSNAYLFYHGGE